jgi:hypothetical protein
MFKTSRGTMNILYGAYRMYSGRGVKLTVELHLVPRLEMNRVVLVLRHA